MKKRFRNFIESKKTTAILLILLLTPFLVLGFILLRDSLKTGTPILGDRFDNSIQHEISSDQIEQLDNKINNEIILDKKITLKVTTLRIYLEVDQEVSKDAMSKLAEEVFNLVDEVLPLETYFTLDKSFKQYDLEIHIFNNVEDLSSDEFVYYQLIKGSSAEDVFKDFVTDVKDEEFKQEVLDNLNKDEDDNEDDEGND